MPRTTPPTYEEWLSAAFDAAPATRASHLLLSTIRPQLYAAHLTRTLSDGPALRHRFDEVALAEGLDRLINGEDFTHALFAPRRSVKAAAACVRALMHTYTDLFDPLLPKTDDFADRQADRRPPLARSCLMLWQWESGFWQALSRGPTLARACFDVFEHVLGTCTSPICHISVFYPISDRIAAGHVSAARLLTPFLAGSDHGPGVHELASDAFDGVLHLPR